MQTVEERLRAQPPESLGKARANAHKAAQLLSMAARANLDAVPDDSHSNLAWDEAEERFLSKPLPSGSDTLFVGLSLSPLRLMLVHDSESAAFFDLDGVSYPDAHDWLDTRLTSFDLKTTEDVSLPYDLPPDVAEIETFEETVGTDALSAWFHFADGVLRRFAEENSGITPGPSPVRCWPHHFDIATYVGLEEGDFETAKGIGVGMSPGDESYDQPYFYINPWPHLDPEGLPPLPAPGHWHTEGFVGAISTAEEVLSLDDVEAGLSNFITEAFAIGRQKLGV